MHFSAKVLIVDDSDFDRELCSHLLTATNNQHQVRTAASCKQTITVLQSDRAIDCILLDLHLADGLGSEIIPEIRAISPEVAIVMLTGDSDMGIALACLQQGADDYLIKGEFSSEVLNRAVRYAIERRKAHFKQQELMVALKQEQEINETHKEFICLVAHEFKTPLSIISGAVQLLQAANEQSDMIGRQCSKIETSITRLSSLMDSVLLLRKLEDNQLAGSHSVFDIASVIQNAVRTMQHDASRVAMHFAADPVLVTGNASLCECAVGNIIKNALKYSSDDTAIDIEIVTEGQFASICISDQGIGMNNDTLSRIGERFVRGQGTFSYPGIGLGLYLATQFASHDGGAIYVCSEEKKGTRVMLKWPLANVRAQRQPLRAAG